jgi:hypothetical protein
MAVDYFYALADAVTLLEGFASKVGFALGSGQYRER